MSLNLNLNDTEAQKETKGRWFSLIPLFQAQMGVTHRLARRRA